MGLDIYFHKTTRKEWHEYQDECDKLANLSDEEKEKGFHGTEAPDNHFSPEEIGYFRKVNLLMEFFNYTGNCEYKEITREQLEDLKNRCMVVSLMRPSRVEYYKPDKENPWDKARVVKVYSDEDKKKCAEILPTCAGFFFGSTDYDEWYFADVKEVLVWVTGVLDNLKKDEVVLMYCWW